MTYLRKKFFKSIDGLPYKVIYGVHVKQAETLEGAPKVLKRGQRVMADVVVYKEEYFVLYNNELFWGKLKIPNMNVRYGSKVVDRLPVSGIYMTLPLKETIVYRDRLDLIIEKGKGFIFMGGQPIKTALFKEGIGEGLSY